MKNNKKKKIEVYNKGREEGYSEGITDCIYTLIFIFFFISLFTSIVLVETGFFDSNVEKLGIEDKVAKEYVISHYPQYENCSMEWNNDFSSKEKGKVKVYCGNTPNKDDLKIEELNPTEIITFKISIDEAFKRIYLNKQIQKENDK